MPHKTHDIFYLLYIAHTKNKQPVIVIIIVDPILSRHNKIIINNNNNTKRYTKHKDLLLIYLTIIGLSFIGFQVWYYLYDLDIIYPSTDDDDDDSFE